MAAKTSTQKLDIRWQDRSWQPRIRRSLPDWERSVEPAAVVRMNVPDSYRLRPGPAAPLRPCRKGMTARLVRRVILAFRSRRRRQD